MIDLEKANQKHYGFLLISILVFMLVLSGCSDFGVPVASEDTAIPEMAISEEKIETDQEVATDTPVVTVTPSIEFVPAFSSATNSVTPIPPQPTMTLPPPTETPFPTASFTAITGYPTWTREPTELWAIREKSPTSTVTETETPTLTPTITLTPTPNFAYLRLARPGLFSKVKSGFRMEANISPGEDGMVWVDLIGEDGRLITRQLLNNSGNIGNRFWIAPEIDFDITSVAETSRLVVMVQDVFGRRIALSSVDLILLYVGEDEITPPDNLLEPYIIWHPVHGSRIGGGAVRVDGLARPVNESPLIIELINEAGEVVGSTQIQLAEPVGEHTHANFEAYVPYEVNTRTNVRLTLRQESTRRIGGTVALSSVLIVLEP